MINTFDFISEQVYWVGPILGALLGTYVYQIFFNEPKKKRYTNHIELVEVQSDQKENVNET